MIGKWVVMLKSTKDQISNYFNTEDEAVHAIANGAFPHPHESRVVTLEDVSIVQVVNPFPNSKPLEPIGSPEPKMALDIRIALFDRDFRPTEWSNGAYIMLHDITKNKTGISIPIREDGRAVMKFLTDGEMIPVMYAIIKNMQETIHEATAKKWAMEGSLGEDE
jgi:hypothetical protein